jgi:DNA-binding NarL/FixJ family response regulator
MFQIRNLAFKSAIGARHPPNSRLPLSDFLCSDNSSILMSGVTEANLLERSPKAVICLEASVEIWKRLKQSLDGEDGASEFILARSPEASADILALCRRLAPALLVIEDARIQILPFKQLRELLGRRDIQILVFSDKTSDAAYEHFFQMGCTGVLQSDVPNQTLRRAVQAIFGGELWMPRKVLSRLAQDAFVKGSARRLTRRESDVFKLICLGFTNQQIADQLFISRETVRWHLRSVYSKIGADSRTGAIRYAKYGQEVDLPLDQLSSDSTRE